MFSLFKKKGLSYKESQFPPQFAPAHMLIQPSHPAVTSSTFSGLSCSGVALARIAVLQQLSDLVLR